MSMSGWQSCLSCRLRFYQINLEAMPLLANPCAGILAQKESTLLYSRMKDRPAVLCAALESPCQSHLKALCKRWATNLFSFTLGLPQLVTCNWTARNAMTSLALLWAAAQELQCCSARAFWLIDIQSGLAIEAQFVAFCNAWSRSLVLQVIEQMISENIGDRDLKAPSISYGSTNLYMRGPLEDVTRPNLQKVGNL